MPRGIPSLTTNQRLEIIKRVTDKGERVPDLAREYDVLFSSQIFPSLLVKESFFICDVELLCDV